MSSQPNVLRRPALERLWAGARDRLERRGGSVGGVVTIADPRRDEVEAVASLLGWRRLPDGPLRVRLGVLDRELRASRVGAGLVEVLERIGGPLADRPGEMAASRSAWERLWEEARGHSAVASEPGLAAWLDDLRATGLLRRLAPGAERETLHCALDVLARLPCAGTRLSVLAGEVTGDSHALDPGRPLATLVLRGLAARSARPRPRTPRDRRMLWSWAGVVAGDVSSDVLALNLPALGADLAARWLREFSAAGEPARVTLRRLAAEPLRLPAGTVLSVCENPAVLAEAADRLGPASPPIVCVEGMPAAAALALLEQAVDSGARVRYHGDFDWGGLRVAAMVAGRVQVEPWRFGARDYEEALAGLGARAPLHGRPAYSPWDPLLRPAMQRTGAAVYEEQVLPVLIEDLAAGR